MISRIIRMHDGVSYTHLQSDETGTGSAQMGEDRFILSGPAKISLTKGSYKYGKEMQFSVCAHKEAGFKRPDRNNSDWNTIEICMPLEAGLEMIKEAYKELVKYEY